MTVKYGSGAYQPVHIPHWEYLGSQRLAQTGASVDATIPAGTQIVEIRAEGGALYYNVNLGFATATANGYVPQDWITMIGPLTNLVNLSFYGATSVVIAHVFYYRETKAEA